MRFKKITLRSQRLCGEYYFSFWLRLGRAAPS
jgi:hypothetical protein